MKMQRAFKEVLSYFKGDYEKTLLWFSTKNPGLGDVAPMVMIVNGRTDKLCQFIKSCTEGDHP